MAQGQVKTSGFTYKETYDLYNQQPPEWQEWPQHIARYTAQHSTQHSTHAWRPPHAPARYPAPVFSSSVRLQEISRPPSGLQEPAGSLRPRRLRA